MWRAARSSGGVTAIGRELLAEIAAAQLAGEDFLADRTASALTWQASRSHGVPGVYPTTAACPPGRVTTAVKAGLAGVAGRQAPAPGLAYDCDRARVQVMDAYLAFREANDPAGEPELDER